MPDAATTVLATLIAYKVILLAIGVACERRTRDEADFLLGGRRLGAVVAAISASASSSSVWTLLGVSGYAYSNGLSALWLLPGCIGGFAVNWYLLARRLRDHAAAIDALTVTDVIAHPARGTGLEPAVRGVASGIVVVSLLAYVAAQFHGAGITLGETFGLPIEGSILIGAAVVVAYTLLGGFWAVSVTDTLQGVLMALTAVAIPVAGLVAVGGPGELAAWLQQAPAAYRSPTGDLPLGAAAGLVLGLLAIGLGYPGQPHVVNRFMALRDDRALRQARRIAMGWAVLVYTGMVATGLCARLLLPDLDDGERSFMAITHELFPPVVAAVMVAAVLSAIMSTADSQLLVAASAFTHDLGMAGRDHRGRLRRTRLIVLAVSAGAAAAALLGSETIFRRVLFAWVALGAALGPILVVTLWRRPVGPRTAIATMLTGFGLAIAVYYTPGTSAVVRNGLPILAALAVAVGGSRSQEPRRAGTT